jgi:hypothetical protein
MGYDRPGPRRSKAPTRTVASSSARNPANVTRKWAACPNSHWARQRRQSDGTASTAQRPTSALAVFTTANHNPRASTKQAAPTAASRPPRSRRARTANTTDAMMVATSSGPPITAK